MIRVIVADDHAMFREMLSYALEQKYDIKVVGEAADGPELLSQAARTHPDVGYRRLQNAEDGEFRRYPQ